MAGADDRQDSREPDRSPDARAADLDLCAACAAGDAAALARFDDEHGRLIDAVLARMRLPAAAAADVKQRIYQRLFVAGADGRPRIGEYAGRGDLKTWLRVVVVRTALNFLREADQPALADSVLERVAAPGPDPEVELMKRAYRAEFKEAFRDALDRLPLRERNLLRHVFVDGLSLDQVGGLYHVHRTTALRWMAHAEKSLLGRTRQALMRRLRVGAGEIDSVMRLIASQLEVGLESALEK